MQGLIGYSGEGLYVTRQLASPGTQTNGGSSGISQYGNNAVYGYSGEFGIGASGSSINLNDGGGGGGSGYYGGGALPYWGGGAGGSSFVSGFPGCNAINKEGDNPSQITHSNNPIHYSGYYFTSPSMISGNDEMPSPLNSSSIKGNSEDGYARISVLEFNIPQKRCFSFDFSLIFIFISYKSYKER